MAEIISFGCRLNACEADIIREFTEELGVADYTIINTCAVTSEAERKLRQEIHKLYNKNNNIKIILTGCASAVHAEEYLAMPGVVGIISNDKKLIKEEYQKYATGAKIEKKPIDKVRGFLQIQNGCDHKCTYCIVRISRGANISFPKEDIVAHAKHLLSKGYKEIVLTGVNISSYYMDDKELQLANLIRYILKEVPELQRLRLSSLDPADIDDDLIDIIKNEEKLMPHIHESIQSGDNMILKRMLRRHTREQVIDINNKLLEVRPDIIIGADIIAGFPTETDEMFENTKKLLIEGNISLLHAFPYSKRDGTPAALMPQVQNKVKIHRATELRNLSKEILYKKLQNYIGCEVEILSENDFFGKTNNYIQIKSKNQMEAGVVYKFKCNAVENNMLIGEVL